MGYFDPTFILMLNGHVLLMTICHLFLLYFFLVYQLFYLFSCSIAAYFSYKFCEYMNLFLDLSKHLHSIRIADDLLNIVIFSSIGSLDNLLFHNIVCKQIITGDSHFIKNNSNLNLKQEKTDPIKNLKARVCPANI